MQICANFFATINVGEVSKKWFIFLCFDLFLTDLNNVSLLLV